MSVSVYQGVINVCIHGVSLKEECEDCVGHRIIYKGTFRPGDAFISHQEVWVQAYCACAMATNTVSKDVPPAWADACLEEFKKRFG